MHAITVARNRLLGLPQNVAVKQALVTANGTLITSMDAVVTDCQPASYALCVGELLVMLGMAAVEWTVTFSKRVQRWLSRWFLGE